MEKSISELTATSVLETPTQPRSRDESNSTASEQTGEIKDAKSVHPQGSRQTVEEDPLERIQRLDNDLKRRIRMIKVFARLLAACLSIAVLIPLAITTHKFATTRDQFRTVTNESITGAPVRRTAWARNTVTWPHYTYFSIAIISLFFNLTIMISYLHSVQKANKTAEVAAWFSGSVLLFNLILWSVTAALYKQQAVITTDGRHEDLWGWTCSPAARLIQPVFRDQVDFDKFCDVQSASWYIGLVQIGAVSVTILLYLAAVWRVRSKKAVRRSMNLREMGLI